MESATPRIYWSIRSVDVCTYISKLSFGNRHHKIGTDTCDTSLRFCIPCLVLTFLFRISPWRTGFIPSKKSTKPLITCGNRVAHSLPSSTQRVMSMYIRVHGPNPLHLFKGYPASLPWILQQCSWPEWWKIHGNTCHCYNEKLASLMWRARWFWTNQRRPAMYTAVVDKPLLELPICIIASQAQAWAISIQ